MEESSALTSNVAVIIVNYRNLHDTINCVNSILQNNTGLFSIQVILVDNGSNDGSLTEIKSAFPSIKVIGLDHNLGFAGANNIAILHALKNGADYVFLLNNDAVVMPSTIEKLLEVFNKDSKIGIVGATVLDHENPKIIDNMGAKISYYTGYSKFIANGDLYHENLKSIDVDYTSGAAMVIKREVIDSVGLLPEYYFLYGEEKDYCVRAKQKGYRIVDAAKATIIHKTSSTVNKYLGLKNYYFHRNRLIFLRLHSKSYQYIFAILHSVLIILPFYIFKYFIHEQSRPRDGFNELFNFIRGVFDGVRFKTGYTKEVS